MSIALMLPYTHFASHNPFASVDADIERHLELGAEISEYSTHLHDRGTHEESTQERQHGHDSADPTHDSVFLSAQSIPAALRLGFWPSVYVRNH